MNRLSNLIKLQRLSYWIKKQDATVYSKIQLDWKLKGWGKKQKKTNKQKNIYIYISGCKRKKEGILKDGISVQEKPEQNPTEHWTTQASVVTLNPSNGASKERGFIPWSGN